MYAVIKAGGKQHKVKTGDVLEIELMHRRDTVTFNPFWGRLRWQAITARRGAGFVTAKLRGSRRRQVTCSSQENPVTPPAGAPQR